MIERIIADEQYAKECLAKGYKVYIYLSAQGYYSIKSIDPKYVDVEKFKDRPEVVGNILYTRWEDIYPVLLDLNKNYKSEIEEKAEEYYRKNVLEPCKKEEYVDENGQPILCKDDIIEAYIAGFERTTIM